MERRVTPRHTSANERFPLLIDLYLQGRLDLDAFVTETITLDGVEEAFTRIDKGEVLRSVVTL
ncbi:Zn-dependent alcohol dehydrogenase [Streptomyces rishiriensis]|uniref:Zn-dependent alcohol dehydrogenase n=1 Tax=Streptomyces rishiriensis TaxID=68264 RepID=A0ABU0NI21_STRRH|nr:Zn-dependent alcohol dehydrogenase [Streptomyces rishiriensis]